LQEIKAAKLLDLAAKAFEENKVVLAKAIIDNIMQKFPGGETALKAKELLDKVNERLDQIRKAVEEWPAVKDAADKLAKKGDIAGARKLVNDFIGKYPDFVPAKEFMVALR
jgi:TolA-binding protein